MIAIRPIPPGDASSFIIHDNSSEISKFIPENYVEPLVIIARILGFDGIDDYIIHLIKDRLEMFADTTDCCDDLKDSFQEYMYDMIRGREVPNERAPTRHCRHDLSKTVTKTKAEETADDGTTEETTTGVVENTTTAKEVDDTNEEKDQK